MVFDRLDFRFDTAHTPHGRRELARLIEDVFEIDVTPLDRLGHDPSVVSFGWWDGETLVANVSLYERRLRLLGRDLAAFGMQSVATRPEWRRRGLFGDLMRRALDYADARAELVILGTATPEVYAPFGFRPIRQFSCSGPIVPTVEPAEARLLSLADDADVALLLDLFARRAPVSDVHGASDHPALFMLKALEDEDVRLLHLPRLDAVVAVEASEPGEAGGSGRLVLLDVVAPQIPPLARIAAAVDARIRFVEVQLTPDKLGWTPAEVVAEDTGYLVRGVWPLDGMPDSVPAMLTSMVI